MKNSNLSAILGLLSLTRDNGETSIGYSVIKVGSIKLGSTIFSKIEN